MDGSVSSASGSETVETVEVPAGLRPLLTTPLNDYSVTEGLLLLILLTLIVSAVVRFIRG